MRIALHNPYVRRDIAELESIQRFLVAAERGGHTVLVANRAWEIRPFAPDFVIAMSHQIPKLTSYPTYGIVTAPTSFFEADDRFIRNILSYDGQLLLPDQRRQWLRDYLCAAGLPARLGDFAFTCHATEFVPGAFAAPRLAYFGTNWDSSRFAAFFERLAESEQLLLYGPAGSWRHVRPSAWQGAVPFDGTSSLECYRRAGVGLCLHRPEFVQDNVPSNRLFEIVASGALAICDRMAFVRQHFGDTVRYLDSAAEPADMVEQVRHHLAWVASHVSQASEMARAAHTIFSDKFSMERMLVQLIQFHQQSESERGRPAVDEMSAASPISVVVRLSGRSEGALVRSLESVRIQCPGPVETLLPLSAARASALSHVLSRFEDLNLRVVPVDSEHGQGSLAPALAAARGEFVALLVAGDVWHRQHLAQLLSAMRRNSSAVVSYAACLDVIDPSADADESDLTGRPRTVWPPDPDEQHTIGYTDDVRLTRFEDFRREEFDAANRAVRSSAVLAKAAIVHDALRTEPGVDGGEVWLLLRLLLDRGDFAFSWSISVTRHVEEPGDLPWTDLPATLRELRDRRQLFDSAEHAALTGRLRAEAGLMVEEVDRRRHPAVVVFGSTAFGRQLVDECLRCAIPVTAMVDSKTDRHGSIYRGVPCHAVDDLVGLGAGEILVGSILSADDIEQSIGRIYRAAGVPVPPIRRHR